VAYFLGIVVAAAIGGLIQRPRSTDATRWSYTRVWMLLMCPCVAVAGIGAALSRGPSKSSLALIASSLILIGAVPLLLVDADVPDDAVDDDGWTWVALRLTDPSPARRTISVVWGVAALLLLTSGLRFSGAFVDEPALTRVSAITSLGRFGPLSETKPIAVGQCLDARELRAENAVAACEVPHRSEIVSQVDRGKSCPAADTYPNTGLDLKVVAAGPFDGAVYCVVQSSSPALRWTERVVAPELAFTP
jgi:hypothetical protein